MENIMLKFKQINIKTLILEIFLILLGTFITSVGFTIFLEPHNISPGGFMGLSKLIFDLLSKVNFTYISVSVWYIIINIFLYLYAVKKLGLGFGIRTGVGIFSYSFFVGILENLQLTKEITSKFIADSASSYILYAIYGGLLMGIGLGIVFMGNGSTGGCDTTAVLVNKFFPSVTTGQLIMIVDGFVVLLSALTYQSLVLPLYALITIFICGKLSDVFVDGVKSFRAYYIITTKKDELSNAVFNVLKRGATNINCEGGYTHEQKDMLLVIVTRAQVLTLKKLVREIDPNSFMFSANIKEAYGNGFIEYKNKINKKLQKNMKKNEKNVKNEENLTKFEQNITIEETSP